MSDSLLDDLLSANDCWAEGVENADPGFFERSAQSQSPRILWIGCSDSRVPPAMITAAKPGDIFVHRNIGNQFHPDDVNALSVLEFAVNGLVIDSVPFDLMSFDQVPSIKHVIVVGHTECGAAGASLASSISTNKPVVTPDHDLHSPLDRWLAPLKRLAASLGLSATPPAVALPIVIEENVKRQVRNICETTIITNAWLDGRDIRVHGWVYELATGRLRDLKVTQGIRGVQPFH